MRTPGAPIFAPARDDSNVVRRGSAKPEKIDNSIGQHPEGPVGFSVECGNCSVEELSQGVPHGKTGVTTVGDIRSAGGDVIKTTGRSPNNATDVGIDPETARIF